MKAKSIIRFGAVGVLAAMGLLGSSSLAFASSSAQHGSATLLNPVISGPAPNLPANCPFSNTDLALNFVDGSAVFYGTQNANGQWGGANAEGTGAFSQAGTTLYTGHLHVWFGNGNNAAGQAEFGFTLEFLGSGSLGNLTIHVNGGATTNNSGTPTANHKNVNVTCS